MKVEGDWLRHRGTQLLCNALERAGHKALLVGGCVRNALLDQPVSDTDLATDAKPQVVTDLAEAAGFRVIPTGFDHGTVTVIVCGKPHEVTTFRRDVATDGRHAKVIFSRKIEEDAARRDFTMNALYADRHGEVTDPLGGLPDVLDRVVRFVGDPGQRIREDYLRILRFFRFHAWYGDSAQGLDAHGLAACAALADGIDTLSAERIGAEMRKLLAAPDPAPAVASMARAGILARVLPGADTTALAPLVHLEAGETTSWLCRLAVIGGEDPTHRWRLSRAESVSLQHIRTETGSTLTPAALAWKIGANLAQDTILARAAVLNPVLPAGWQIDIARGTHAKPPVTAADLMPTLEGPALGKALKAAEGRWLESDLRLSRADLLP